MNAIALPQRTALQPQTFEQMMKYAELVAKSDLVPKDYQDKPHNCLIAMQWATELGMNPLQGLQNIAVINGRPSLWGDMLPALVKAHGSYEWMRETLERDEKGDVIAALCEGKRKGHPEPEARRFSVQDAIAAGLWGKAGPWKQYPQRMLQMRARAWLCRDLWADALRGMAVAEEVQDYVHGEVVSSSATQIGLPPKNLIADDRKQRHDEACEQYEESIRQIKEAIEEDMPYRVAELWAEIPAAAQTDLWLAPTKGGTFSTAERAYIKKGVPTEGAVNQEPQE